MKILLLLFFTCTLSAMEDSFVEIELQEVKPDKGKEKVYEKKVSDRENEKTLEESFVPLELKPAEPDERRRNNRERMILHDHSIKLFEAGSLEKWTRIQYKVPYETIEDYCTPLGQAIKDGQEDRIQTLLEAGCPMIVFLRRYVNCLTLMDYISVSDYDPSKPKHLDYHVHALFFAAILNKPELISLFLPKVNQEIPCIDISALTPGLVFDDMYTPLQIAAKYGYKNVVSLLVKTATEVNITKAIRYAKRNNQPHVVNLLESVNRSNIQRQQPDQCQIQ